MFTISTYLHNKEIHILHCIEFTELILNKFAKILDQHLETLGLSAIIFPVVHTMRNCMHKKDCIFWFFPFMAQQYDAICFIKHISYSPE